MYTRRFAILEELDVFEARRAGRELARSLGFSTSDAEELVLVIAELATNIVEHGVRGEVTLDAVDVPPFGPGVRVTARDVGPPFARPELTDGIGEIVGLCDAFEQQLGRGEKRLVATRYLKRPERDQNASSTASQAMSANTPK